MMTGNTMLLLVEVMYVGALVKSHEANLCETYVTTAMILSVMMIYMGVGVALYLVADETTQSRNMRHAFHVRVHMVRVVMGCGIMVVWECAHPALLCVWTALLLVHRWVKWLDLRRTRPHFTTDEQTGKIGAYEKSQV